MDTEHTDLADVRVINYFEDVSNQRELRIGLKFNVISVFIGEERSIGFGRIREVADHHVDESSTPAPVLPETKQIGMMCLRGVLVSAERVVCSDQLHLLQGIFP